MIVVTSSFSKSFVLKIFPFTLKHKACVFKFLRFEKRFRKPSFSLRTGVDGSPDLHLIPPGRGVKLLISNGRLFTFCTKNLLAWKKDNSQIRQ